MTKIIRVTGCHECAWTLVGKTHFCNNLNDWVLDYIKSETLPDNCPLEDEISMVEEFSPIMRKQKP